MVPLPFFAQPRYYTTHYRVCQHFFVEFLRFGDSVKTHKCSRDFLGRVHKGAEKKPPPMAGANIKDSHTD